MKESDTVFYLKGRKNNKDHRKKQRGKKFIMVTNDNRVKDSMENDVLKSAELQSCSCRPCKTDIIFKLLKYIIIIIPFIIILRYFIMNSSLFFRTTPTMPFSLHLNKQDLVLVKGEEFKLSVFGINKRVSYSSTNFRVVGVNFNGRIFAYNTGKAFILVKVDKRILKCRVTVIDINKEKLVLKAGKTGHLRIKGIGLFTFPGYKSDNKSVASVSLFGKVTARRKGRTVITVKVKGKVFTCQVTVR